MPSKHKTWDDLVNILLSSQPSALNLAVVKSWGSVINFSINYMTQRQNQCLELIPITPSPWCRTALILLIVFMHTFVTTARKPWITEAQIKHCMLTGKNEEAGLPVLWHTGLSHFLQCWNLHFQFSFLLNSLGKAVKDGPSVWAPVTHIGN